MSSSSYLTHEILRRKNNAEISLGFLYLFLSGLSFFNGLHFFIFDGVTLKREFSRDARVPLLFLPAIKP